MGGGPAGAATAALLADRGRDVLLLEKAAFPREKPCAEFLSPGVIDVLDRMGALDAVLATSHARPLGMRVHTPRDSFLLAYADGSARRSGLSVARPAFDCALLQHARSRGARVEERVQVLGAFLVGGRVAGVRARRGVREEVVRAGFVVAADGLHSAVARSLGLETRVRWPRRLGLVARYAGVAGLDQHGEMHVGRRKYCGLAPLGDGLLNVGLVTGLGDRAAGEPIDRYFDRCLDELPAVQQVLRGARRITPVRGMGPLARRVRQVAGPGYVLVGDAAGFLDPFTGEGVYRALRGAELAAEAIDRSLAHGAAEPQAYAQARGAAFRDKERVCWLVQLFLAWPPLFDRAVRHLGQRPELTAVLAGALGDYRPAAEALRPSYLWSLLRP